MLIEAVRWNTLNLIRVELFFDLYRLWNIIISSNIQTQRGQYALISLLITLIAQVSVQFNFSWLLTFYTTYLIAGASIWLYRRVYFYHRKQDPMSLRTVLSEDISINKVHNIPQAPQHPPRGSGNSHNNFMGTLKHVVEKHSKNNHGDSATSGASSSSSTSSSSSNNNGTNNNGAQASLASQISLNGGKDNNNHHHNENTNSLHRQRVTAYRDFQNVLSEPRRNPREFALSLAHLSHIAKLVAADDVFDEMHFQILATRRDVANLILRFVLITACTVLAYS